MSFFPKNDADADRKNGNVKAGTTVDTAITSPFQFGTPFRSFSSVVADDSLSQIGTPRVTRVSSEPVARRTTLCSLTTVGSRPTSFSNSSSTCAFCSSFSSHLTNPLEQHVHVRSLHSLR